MQGWTLGLAAMTGLFAAAAAAGARADDAGAKAELAPTGVVRVALVEAPNAGAFFVARGPDGAPRGVTADLGADLARALGVAAAFAVYPNSGDATEATRQGAVDVAFMPVDDARRAVVAFGPAYTGIESTYLVTAASGIDDLAGVDRAGLRVIAIAGTTTFRAAARTLTRTQPVAVPSVGEAVAALKEGRADAFALTRESLEPYLPALPGARILEGGFQRTSVSVAVAREHPAALAFVTAWLTGAKRDGTVRRIFDAHGLREQAVAE